MRKTPLAFFAYNRPSHADMALRSLARCRRISECQVILYGDAPKDEKNREGVSQTRAVLRSHAAGLGARVIERESNLGLCASISSTVTELCAEYGGVIVLEDDLLVRPDFVDYMLLGLDKYQDESRVLQISGFLYNIPVKTQYDGFFIPLTTTWGWATWKRAWDSFSMAPEGVEKWLADERNTKGFDLGLEGRPYSSMLRDRMAGRNDSWGIYWWFAVHRQGGLVLYPKSSLVYNNGFDGSGVHCAPGSRFDGLAPDDLDKPSLGFPIALPGSTAADMEVFGEICRYLRTVGVRAAPPGLKERIKRFIRRINVLE